MIKKPLPMHYRLLALTYVSSRFADFHNPRNRGSKFRWSQFPDLVYRLATTDLFLYFKDGESEPWKEAYGKEVHDIATRLVNLQGPQPEEQLDNQL